MPLCRDLKRFRLYRGKVVRGTGRIFIYGLVGALLGSIAWYTRPRPARTDAMNKNC